MVIFLGFRGGQPALSLAACLAEIVARLDLVKVEEHFSHFVCEHGWHRLRRMVDWQWMSSYSVLIPRSQSTYLSVTDS